MVPILCLTGIDGCGKSTHLRALARRFLCEGSTRARILNVWDISSTPRYQSHPFISDREAIHRYLASLHSVARMLFIAHALMESLDLLVDDGCDLVLADGYWYKYLCSESLHGLPLERLKATVASLPEPARTVLLDVPPERAWARKPASTIYECGLAEPGREAFVSFQSRLRQTLLDLGRRSGWPTVDADRPVEAVSDELWDVLRKEV